MKSSLLHLYMKLLNVGKKLFYSKRLFLGVFLLLSGRTISQLDFEPLFGVDQKKKALYELLTYGQGNFGVAVDRLQVKKRLKPTTLGQIDSLLSIQYRGFGRKKVFKLYYNGENFLSVERRKNSLIVNYNIHQEIYYSFALDHADSFTQVLVKTQMNSPDIAHKWKGRKNLETTKDNRYIKQMEEVYHQYVVPFEPLTKK